ncbi:MAG: hypothetical protein IKN46_04250 [Acholeplasmatales bacterium]|nr:hypothetical protein [Acholeplasmatales bacterium]
MKFYKENGTILEAISGEANLTELKSRGVDASFEKHVPVVKIDGDMVVVTVGANIHPMDPNHYIEFIEIETKRGVQRKNLKPGDTPVVTFKLVNDEFVNAYAYCNLHGLWDGK